MAESVLDPSQAPSHAAPPGRNLSRHTALFSITLLVGSFLLFLIQPMFARMILPTLGGTPAVWNTCMVFFQACLLAGYAYAHGMSTKLPRRPQVILHAMILLLPLIVLPVALPGRTPPAESNPIPWLLMVLALAVGLPFVVVSTGGPLMQKWFALTGQRGADDP